MRRLSTAIPETTALIGFAGSPWTVACYMVEGCGSKEYAKVKKFAYGDPQGFAALIDLLVTVTADYLNAQIEAGAEAVQVFDSWAGVLPAPEFRRWVIEPTRKLVELIKAKHPHVPVIGFPRGAGEMYKEYAEVSGVSALGLDTTVPPEWAAAELQTKLPVQGNLDPIMLVAGGEALRNSAIGILQDAVERAVRLQSRPWRGPIDAARACRTACRTGKILARHIWLINRPNELNGLSAA